MVKGSLEGQFIEWEDWSQVDVGCLQFEDCTVIKPFGNFEAGTKLDVVSFDMQTSECKVYETWEEEGTEVTFKMEVNLVPVDKE